MTLIKEISDSKLDNFHALKVTSNTQKININGLKKWKFYRDCNIKRATLRNTYIIRNVINNKNQLK